MSSTNMSPCLAITRLRNSRFFFYLNKKEEENYSSDKVTKVGLSSRSIFRILTSIQNTFIHTEIKLTREKHVC